MLFQKDNQVLSLKEFQSLTGAPWVSKLFFDPKIYPKLLKTAQKLKRAGEISLAQLWLGRYFQKELFLLKDPDVAIGWLNSVLGWGVIALRDFRKMEFITEYSGLVRKSVRRDRKNAYCFEYPIASGVKTSYTIDALEQGGLARYINHSSNPNLQSSLATLEDVGHIILYTKKAIAKGDQLCYDYGPDYWAGRPAPVPL